MYEETYRIAESFRNHDIYARILVKGIESL